MPRRDKLVPDYDPIVFTLDKNPDQCTQVEGKFGVDYQYIVNSDSGIMWLPKAGRDALIQSGARAGDQVEFSKSKRSGYVATVLTEAREPHRPQQSAGQTTAVPPATASAPVAGLGVEVHLMKGCYASAVDVALAAVTYAKERGLLLSPSFEDVRCLAATFYIAV